MTYEILKKLIRDTCDDDMELKDEVIGSQAKGNKKQIHLYGKKETSIGSRSSRQTYITGIIQQKGYVGLYFMPIYSHPKKFNGISDKLKKTIKGKSCLHIKELDAEMEKEIQKILKEGIDLYRKEGWI